MRVLIPVWLALALSTPTAHARLPTPQDLMAMENVTEVALSPDEDWVVFAKTSTDLEHDSHRQDLWLVSIDGGQPRRLTRGGTWNGTPHWLDDSRRLFFTSDRAGARQVFRIAIDGGEATQVTDAERGVENYAVDRDGNQLAYTTRGPAPDGSGARVVDAEFTMSHLHLKDLPTGRVRQVTEGSYTVNEMSFSPDATRLVYSRQDTPRTIDWFFTSDLFVVDLTTGESSPLVMRPGMDSSPRWAPAGNNIVFFSHDGVENWIGTTHLCVVDARSGEVRNLTPQVQERIYGWDLNFAWAADARSVWFVRPVGVVDRLMRIDVATAEAEFLGDEHVLGPISAGARGKVMVGSIASPTAPTEVYRLNPRNGRASRLTVTNPQLEDLDISPATRMRWTSFDDRLIEGVYFAPHPGSPTPAPLVLVLHGGPSSHVTMAFTPQTGARWMVQGEFYPYQVFAARGYGVLLPNFRGSGAYGADHLYANLQDWGYGDLQDVLAGIDVLVADGRVDPERVGVMGWSYGGTLSAFALTQTDRFAAASVGAGVTNHVSAYGTMDIPPFLEAYFGGSPGEVPQNYLRSSTMNFADRINTPALLLYGENDQRVPLPQGKELYWAMKKRGVDVEMVVYPRSGHAVFEPKLQLDLMQRNLDWFARWLGDNPAPLDSSRR